MNTKILDVRQGKVVNPVSELHAKDAMIEWLARELADRTEVCTDCPAYIGERCMEPTKRCYNAWINEAAKAVQNADTE